MMKSVRILTSLSVILAISTASAELARWRGYEVELNDLVLNRLLFDGLPSADELSAMQANSVFVVKVPSSAVHVIANAQGGNALAEFVDPRSGEVSFFIHPASLGLFSDLLEGRAVRREEAGPTSSGRTFFWNRFHLKLSLAQRVNGAIRTVYPLQMERALAISEMLSEMPATAPGFEHFAYLPEVLGIYDAKEEAPYGFIVREIPREIIEGTTTLAPLTAYCAKGKGGTPSLFEVDAKAHGMAPSAHARSNLVPAMMKAFTAAASLGVAIEAHQQNLLLELDHQERFTGRIFFRDLDGARVDFDMRAQRGLSTDHLKKVSNAEWVFELGRIRALNQSASTPEGRPWWWSGLIEEAFSTYLSGSSFFLLEKAIERVEGRNLFRLKDVAAAELRRLAQAENTKGQSTQKSEALGRGIACENTFK
jgi:hypothetical protein